MEVDQTLSQAEQADQLAGLLLKYLRQEINEQEQQQLNNWIAEHPSHKQVFDRINDEQHLQHDLQLMRKVNLEAWWLQISRQAMPLVHATPFYRRWFFYFLVVLLIVAGGLLLWIF